MRTQRPFLHAFLGLMLWVQGVAIAAAPVDTAAPAGDSAAQVSAEIPCHGDVPDASVPACDCCDGSCDSMIGCAVGSFAGATPPAVQADAPAHAVVTARTWSSQTTVPPLPLRPPITSHA